MCMKLSVYNMGIKELDVYFVICSNFRGKTESFYYTIVVSLINCHLQYDRTITGTMREKKGTLQLSSLNKQLSARL